MSKADIAVVGLAVMGGFSGHGRKPDSKYGKQGIHCCML
jgi:hypothetical protein